MPRNVRNWWVEGTIDGRAMVKLGGPQAKDGGFTLTVFQRDEGSVKTALRLSGWVDGSGILRLDVAQGDLPIKLMDTNAPEGLKCDLRITSKR